MLEGLAYRITPFNWTEITSYSEEMGIYEAAVDTEKFYDNVMNRFKWGGIKENEDYYADETIRRMVTTHRSFISMLAGSMFIELNYIDAADTDRQIEQTKKIIALLERCETEFPEKTTGFDPYRDSYNAVKNANIYQELYEIQKENKNTGIYLGDDTCNMLKEKYLEQSANVMRRCMEYLRLYESYSKQERNADLEATYTQLLQYATQYFFNGMKEDEIGGALEKYSVGFTLQDIYRQLKKARK